MDKWNGRVALVTGAGAGIGAAICEALVKHGMKVVGADKRLDRVQDLSVKLKAEKGSFEAVKCDVTKDEEVYALFDKINKNYGGLDICINNAGMSFSLSLLDGNSKVWRFMSDLNIISLCLCTKLAVASMRERDVDDGHIINLCSISGHEVDLCGPSHFYCGTKFAVRAITEGLRQELREIKSHIRVTAISPGLVKTEFHSVMYPDSDIEEQTFNANAYMVPEDIASIALHILSAPSHVEINDIIVTPQGERKYVVV